MHVASRILILLLVVTGMLIGDARISVGCKGEQTATAKAASAQSDGSCCSIKNTASKQSAPKSCCAGKTATNSAGADKAGQPTESTDSCCCSGDKPACGCHCSQPSNDRVPPNRAPQPPPSTGNKLAAVASFVALTSSTQTATPETYVVNHVATSGPACSIFFCRWRN